MTIPSVVVVLDRKTKSKLVPFVRADNGEIIITSSGSGTEDDFIVSTLPANKIDWDNNLVIFDTGKDNG
jgi:hypothetical protein